MDRGAGYVSLVTDTATQHDTGNIWKYKAIFRIDDTEAGQWIQEVSVVVGG